MLITKTQAFHDKFVIQAMATSFVLCSMMPSAERQKPPTDPQELLDYQPNLVIHDQTCEEAAEFIFHISEELSKRLTILRHDSHIYDYNPPYIQKQRYLHYVRAMTEIKGKAGKSGGVVVSWPALLEGRRARMFLPHFLILREFIHFTPHLSNLANDLLSYIVNDDANIIYNDNPDSINVVRQMIENTGERGEPFPSN